MLSTIGLHDVTADDLLDHLVGQPLFVMSTGIVGVHLGPNAVAGANLYFSTLAAMVAWHERLGQMIADTAAMVPFLVDDCSPHGMKRIEAEYGDE